MKKKLIESLFILYKTLTVTKVSTCRFIPSCSEYAKEAFIYNNPAKATRMTLRRISKCHPFSKAPIYDPIPQ